MPTVLKAQVTHTLCSGMIAANSPLKTLGGTILSKCQSLHSHYLISSLSMSLFFKNV